MVKMNKKEQAIQSWESLNRRVEQQIKASPYNSHAYVFIQKLGSTCDNNGNYKSQFQFILPTDISRLLNITYIFADILGKSRNTKGMLSLSDDDLRFLEIKITEYFQNKKITFEFNYID